jgi:hypothetical protein
MNRSDASGSRDIGVALNAGQRTPNMSCSVRAGSLGTVSPNGASAKGCECSNRENAHKLLGHHCAMREPGARAFEVSSGGVYL